jgi:hypothetical protein
MSNDPLVCATSGRLVDMSPEAIERRLRQAAQLYKLTRSLQAAKFVELPGRQSTEMVREQDTTVNYRPDPDARP